MLNLKKGIFVTFEGPEGCGKSTQVYKLTEALRVQGYEVIATREPGGTAIGQQIRNILLNPDNVSLVHRTEVLMFAADRIQHLEEKIWPALKQKKIVICDRYIDSTTAYQIGGRPLPAQLISEINRISTENLKPDLTFLLDIPVAEGLKRATQQSSDRFEKEFISFHEGVRRQYLELAKAEPERIVMLNGLDAIEQIHHQVLTITHKLFEKNAI
ncbi:MAG: dTMP kinase [Candidatus Margulisbacteria bacterium]|nr:dTMP kinase [Candidatus Margulisiibacteriota bacterium]